MLMSLKNTFSSFCKTIIYRKVPSYEPDKFMIADIQFPLIFKAYFNIIPTLK